MIFPFGTLRLRKQLGADGLTRLRCIMLGMIAAMPLFVVSFSYIVDEPRPKSPLSSASP